MLESSVSPLCPDRVYVQSLADAIASRKLLWFKYFFDFQDDFGEQCVLTVHTEEFDEEK